MSERTVAVSLSVSSSAAAVWAVIRRGDNVHLALPGAISSCEVAEDGKTRVCGTPHAGSITETILGVDDEARLFSYRIDAQEMLPMADYVGHLHVSEGPDGGANVLWAGSYRALDPAAAQEIDAALRGLYRQGIEGFCGLVGSHDEGGN